MAEQTEHQTSIVSDFAKPYAVQFRGSKLAMGFLKLMGWKVYFDGMPTMQGVAVVYPHTSNWDAPIMFLAKSAIGVKVMFWGKDTIFRIPLLGAWLRWIGGVPVKRTSAEGIVGQAVKIIAEHKKNGEYFWLGLSPEGTRKYIPGWRSGFYQTALLTQVPVCVAKLDYAKREISVRDFVVLTGDMPHDMARIAGIYEGVRGYRPELAAPVQILDPKISRQDTVVH
jgi:1-acyl-sn-glycerol-3-phosphate acyltransferase